MTMQRWAVWRLIEGLRAKTA